MRNMQVPCELRLSLTEWVVLCLIREGPTHGFALSASLTPDSDLGQIWHIQKAVVYRAVERLEHLGLIRTTGHEPSNLGPVRSLVKVTPQGRYAAKSWLASPVAHPRDVRSELLLKLALLDRANASPADLLRKQREQLLPIAAAIAARLEETTGFERTLTLWRHESISAILHFLNAVSVAASSSP
jgi:DNA-binding PadR family transcriptional regulator